jgi:hypothetical protein
VTSVRRATTAPWRSFNKLTLRDQYGDVGAVASTEGR